MSIFYGSRYETATLIVVTDASGDQNLTSFRSDSPLPAPLSYNTYIVQVNDRLDVLAYKFYQRSDYYWVLADANPGIQLAPLVPGTTIRIPNVIG